VTPRCVYCIIQRQVKLKFESLTEFESKIEDILGDELFVQMFSIAEKISFFNDVTTPMKPLPRSMIPISYASPDLLTT
jgi:hypothetical protein